MHYYYYYYYSLKEEEEEGRKRKDGMATTLSGVLSVQLQSGSSCGSSGSSASSGMWCTSGNVARELCVILDAEGLHRHGDIGTGSW